MQNSLADEPLPFHHPPPPSPLVEQKSAVAVAYARAGKGLVKLNGEETRAFGIGAAASPNAFSLSGPSSGSAVRAGDS